MYYTKTKVTISAAHNLNLDYSSRCVNTHGHNWEITVYCKSYQLNSDGMVVDFNKIKEVVRRLDHININLVILQPTAENIAKYLADQIVECYKVKIKETDNNTVIYCKEDIAF